MGLLAPTQAKQWRGPPRLLHLIHPVPWAGSCPADHCSADSLLIWGPGKMNKNRLQNCLKSVGKLLARWFWFLCARGNLF